MTHFGLFADEETAVDSLPVPTEGPRPAYSLRPIMRQGTAMYYDDRVLAFIVIDGAPPRLVKWVER